jgi:hypothetical protein
MLLEARLLTVSICLSGVIGPARPRTHLARPAGLLAVACAWEHISQERAQARNDHSVRVLHEYMHSGAIAIQAAAADRSN